MFSKFCQECRARLKFVGKNVYMIPFTCELNKVNIATRPKAMGAVTGLLSEASERSDSLEGLLRSNE